MRKIFNVVLISSIISKPNDLNSLPCVITTPGFDLRVAYMNYIISLYEVAPT